MTASDVLEPTYYFFDIIEMGPLSLTLQFNTKHFIKMCKNEIKDNNEQICSRFRGTVFNEIDK